MYVSYQCMYECIIRMYVCKYVYVRPYLYVCMYINKQQQNNRKELFYEDLINN